MSRKKINSRQQLVHSTTLGLLGLGLGLFNVGIIKAQNKPVKNSDLKANSKKTIVKDTVKSNKDDIIFDEYETMPIFPEGDQALLDFIHKNLKYPDSAIKDKIEGRVVLRFLVTKTGELDKVEIVRSLQPDCDKEAVRVVKMLPKFIPGKQNGKLVDIWYILPVIFKNSNNKKTSNPRVEQTIMNDTVYTVTDQTPEFPGGLDALVTFIKKNLNRQGQLAGCFGEVVSDKVVCRFVVEKDGSISNITIIRSLCSGCDEEAVRVLRLLPKFNPAKHKGQVVRAYFIVPVSFRL